MYVDAEFGSSRIAAGSAEGMEPPAVLGLVVFVVVKAGVNATPELKEQLRAHVGKEIGSLAKPDDVRFAAGLPKTRSGKIMRRLLKQVAAGTEIKGDTTTLEDFNVLAKLSTVEE